MKLIIVSGLSGSGKTVALHTLEDQDFYCVDNLPLGLLPELVDQLLSKSMLPYSEVAVGIDARSDSNDLRRFNEIIKPLRARDIDINVIYLQAELPALIRRFSDTRRKHPLSRRGLPLSESVEVERVLLSEIASEADLFVDTTYTNVHQLRDLIKTRVIGKEENSLSILFQSFGFKYGAPTDSDFVFDIRCLPNPHWEPRLQPLTGLDQEVIDFLVEKDEVQEMFDHIKQFMQTWVPSFEQQNRYYLTVSIGCTGGQHRSVYMAERLRAAFENTSYQVSIRHREMISTS